MGSKQWWKFLKEQKGEAKINSIPSLLEKDGSLVHTSRDKANLLARHFAGEMYVCSQPFAKVLWKNNGCKHQ